MSTYITLEKYVATCLAKEAPQKQFLVFVQHLLQKNNTSDNELAEGLVELYGKKTQQSKRSLQLQYALAFASLNSESLLRFFTLLTKVSLESQKDYLSHLKRVYKETFNLIIRDFINRGLHDYTLAFEKSLGSTLSHVEKNVSIQLTFLWGQIIDDALELINQDQFKELAVTFISKLQASGEDVLAGLFSKKANAILDSAALHKDLCKKQALVSGGMNVLVNGSTDKITSASVLRALVLNGHLKKVARLLALKKIMWLNHQFSLWTITDLIDRFLAFFESPASNKADLADDLTRTFFHGFIAVSDSDEVPYVVFNWRTFIVSRLPKYLKELFKALDVDTKLAEDRLIATVMSFSSKLVTQLGVAGWEKQPCDVRRVFLRSCLYNEVISLSSYTNAFAEEASTLSSTMLAQEVASLSRTEALSAEFRGKLTHINPEITSLLESGLVEFFNELPRSNLQFSVEKQAFLLNIVKDTVEAFLSDREHEKLCRFLVAFLLTPQIANYVFFCEAKGPWFILEKLIHFVDSEGFDDDDDERNFQETYAHFGTALSAIVSICQNFGVDFATSNVPESFTVDFINNYYYRLLDNFTNQVVSQSEDEANLIQNYRNVVIDWTSALFDANNEGLSDDLIKSINVKQIYKLIIIMMQKAVIASFAGKIDAQNLYNGIDYLSQEFLVHCSAEVILWLASNIGPLHSDSEFFVQLILRIIQSNMGEDDAGEREANYCFKLILNITGAKVLHNVYALKDWRFNETTVKLEKLIADNLDSEYSPQRRPLLIQHYSKIGGNSLVTVLKQLLICYVRDEGEVTDAVMKNAISSVWGVLSETEILDNLEAEFSAISSGAHHNSPSSEESKIFINFLTFLVVLTSYTDKKKAQRDSSEIGNGIRMVETNFNDFGSEFKLTIDSHYSKAFGEISKSNEDDDGMFDKDKPKLQRKDDLGMDFEMDDLFNDMSDSIFGEQTSNPPTSRSSRPTTPTLDVRQVVENALLDTSLSRRIALCIRRSGRLSEQTKGTLKSVLAKEVEHATVGLQS